MKDKEVKETQVVKPKNKGGRPRKNVARSTVTRATRIPVSGLRDKLTVEGKDPNYHYFWALDVDEHGNELYRLHEAGYEFVQSDSVRVGQAHVHQSAGIGSIVRVPNGDGRYLFLMRLPMQWYLDDQQALEQRNKDQEQAIYNQQTQEGVYGKIELSRK